MATIDIALPDDLMQALTPPACLDLQLPQPDVRRASPCRSAARCRAWPISPAAFRPTAR